MKRFASHVLMALAPGLLLAAGAAGQTDPSPWPSSPTAATWDIDVTILPERWLSSRPPTTVSPRTSVREEIQLKVVEVLRSRLDIAEGEPTSRFAQVTVMGLGSSTGRQVWRVRIDLAPHKALVGGGDDLLNAIVAALGPLGQDRHKVYLKHLEDVMAESRKALAARQEEDKAIQARLEELRKVVPTEFDLAEADQQYRQHTRQATELKLELAGKQARQDAALRRVELVSAQAREKAKDDPVTKALEQLVKLREDELEAQRQLLKAGMASIASVQVPEGAVAEARVKLIERRERVVEMAGGAVLDKLNEELAVLGLDIVELEAKRRMLTEIMGELGKQRQDKRALDEATTRHEEVLGSIRREESRIKQAGELSQETQPWEVTVVRREWKGEGKPIPPPPRGRPQQTSPAP